MILSQQSRAKFRPTPYQSVLVDSPTIAPGDLAAIISAAPERLQKKSDRAPRAAEAWKWAEAEGQWTVNAAEESDRIPSGLIGDVATGAVFLPDAASMLHALTQSTIATKDDRHQDSTHRHPAFGIPQGPSYKMAGRFHQQPGGNEVTAFEGVDAAAQIVRKSQCVNRPMLTANSASMISTRSEWIAGLNRIGHPFRAAKMQ